MKYIRFQLLAILACMAVVLQAQTNVLRVESMKYPAGKTLSLPVIMENQSDIVGVQFDISVPFELVADADGQLPITLSKNRAPYHKLAVRKTTTNWGTPTKSDGSSFYQTYHVYRIIVYSDKNELLLDNQGALVTIDIPLSPEVDNGTVFPVYLLDNSVTLTDRQKQNVLTGQENGTVTIEEIPRPDLQPSDVTFEPSTINPEDELTVKWKVANVGKVATEDGWSEQITLVAVSGNVTKVLTTTYYDQTLAAGATANREVKMTLPALLGIDGLAKVQVTVVPTDKTGEHPSLRDNNTATTSTNLTVGKRLTLELTPQRITEGSNQRITCKLSRSGRWQNVRTFTLKTNDSRLKLPSNSVTVPANQSGVVFYVDVVNNTVLDADSVASITVSGDSYDEVTSSVIIEDDELPALKLTASKSDVNEGETFQMTVSVDKAPKSDVVVKLNSEDSKRFQYPLEVTIPAGQTSVTFNVTAVQNELPNLELANKFTVSAARYEKGEVMVVLHDDDMPVLTLTLTPNVVSEAAGPTAVAAVLTRTGKTDTKISVRISDDSNGGIFYSNKSIEMAKGVETVYFNLGPVDNTIKEGDRTYTLTAGVWVSSCNCASSGEQAGSVSAQLTVLDNDGASLAVASQTSTVKEGDEAKLTITRNTVSDVSMPLTVTLSSDYDAELVYDHNVTIPAGQTSVDVTVQTKKNEVSGDSHTVIFTVAAEGFGSGTCFLLVTDQTLPDARITSLTANVQKAVLGSPVTLTAVVANEGAFVLPKETPVLFYLKGTSKAVATMYTSQDIPVGGNETLTRTLTLPDKVSDCVYYAMVNESRTISELVYTNNTSAEVTVAAISPFTATVQTDKKVYRQGDLVTVSGQISGERTTNAEIDVYLVNAGAREVKKVTTDAEGRFTLEWQLYALQSGHFSVGACFQDDPTTEEQAAFDVYGLKRAENSYITCDVTIGEPKNGIIRLENAGTLPLSGVKTEVLEAPEGCNAQFTVPASIGGGETVNMTYQISGTTPTEGNDWQMFKVRITSAEGAYLEVPIHYYARLATGNLVVESQNLVTTMHKDNGRDYSFVVTNNGKGNTGKITLSLPDWMKALTGATMPGLNQNDTATVVLRMTPTADMQLNVPVTGRLGINCANGNGTYINFTITPVSDLKGTLTVDVTDEYTYYTEEKPHVGGAEIVLKNPVTGALVAQGKSGEDGLFSIELPEGYYQLNVTADKHDSYKNNIVVDPGTTTYKTVNLSYQAVTVSWDVVETEVEDEYNIVTTVQYETNVPMPVVETIQPDELDLKQLGVGESVIYYAVLTNKGLITAENASYEIAEVSGNYRWEPLVENTGLTLAPQQSYVIPVKVTRLEESQAAMRRAGSANGCKQASYTAYEWKCGNDGKWHRYPKEIKYDVCPSNGGGGYGGGGGGGGLGGPNGYGGGGFYTFSSNNNSTTSTDDCVPCLDNIGNALMDIADCPIGFIPIVGTIWGFGRTVYCYTQVSSGWDAFWCTAGLVNTIAGIFPPASLVTGIIGCGLGAIDMIRGCGAPPPPPVGGFTGGGGVPGGNPTGGDNNPKAPALHRTAEVSPNLPQWAVESLERMKPAEDYMNALKTTFDEFFGSYAWEQNCTGSELSDLISALKKAGEHGSFKADDLRFYKPSGISDSEFDHFVARMNGFLEYLNNGTPAENAVNIDFILAQLDIMDNANATARERGYENVGELFNDEMKKFYEKLEEGGGSTCATITLQINQTMTMTRQAFRGTLTITNGNTDTAMKDIKLKLKVTNRQTGTLATAKEFEMHTESLAGFKGELPMDAGWHLGADSTGTATILFIPSKYAAPETPIDYSFGGTLSYIDPYTGLEVTRELYPVTLTVKPSPELDLTYFMQRDIMGDDALTEEVEPMEPSEFALIINNKGNGDATNVKMVTNQPEIIDNQKGLLIDFEFLSSQLNGQDKTLALGQAIPTDFGTIPAHTQAYAQWWLQSTLLGHFVKYNIEATHVTSYGNENLSLLDQVTIHELIRGFTPSLTSQSGRAFLVNDISDADDLPDAIYFTDATQDAVYELASATIDKKSDTEYHLTLVPTQAGWSYGNLLDPTVGRQKLTKIVRQSDGQEINLDNLWQTNRTLRDGRDPIKENRLHFVANMPITGETLVLTFAPKPDVELAVKEYVGVPKEGTVASEPVKQLTVRFNKAIDAATFTTDDITLQCQGKHLDASKIVVTKENENDYNLNLEAVTGGDGYYVLTVQTAGITDAEGFQGVVGKQATWIQFTGGKITLAIKALPADGGTVSPASGQFDFGQTVKLVATPAEGYDFSRWMENDKALTDSATYVYTPQGNADITAVFTPKYFDVTISYDEKGGTVTGGGTGRYTYGTELTLTATPQAGWQFEGWTIDGESLNSQLSTLNWTVNTSAVIQALFTELPTGLLSGRVTRDADDVPIGGAIVTLRSGDVSYAATTDSYGYYQLKVEDKSLTYDLLCQADGYIWSPSVQMWFDEAEQTKNFSLLRGATVVLPQEGACTFSTPVAVTVATETAKAWWLRAYDQQSFVVEQVVDGNIAAGEGIILSGVAGQRIDMAEAASATNRAAGIMGNMLIGTPTAPYVVDDENVYQMREGTTADAKFYLAVRGEVVPKGKAYCLYTLSGQPSEVAILWSDETLINAVLRDLNDPNTPHFDLQGRRIYKIDADVQGKKIHVVKGRKVVIK